MISEMTLLLYPPFEAKTDDELLLQCTVALRAYIEDLAEFEQGPLAAAWREVRRKHTTVRWPTIETIRSACIGVRDDADDSAERKPRGRFRTDHDGKRVYRWRPAEAHEIVMLQAAGFPYAVHTRVHDDFLSAAKPRAEANGWTP